MVNGIVQWWRCRRNGMTGSGVVDGEWRRAARRVSCASGANLRLLLLLLRLLLLSRVHVICGRDDLNQRTTERVRSTTTH